MNSKDFQQLDRAVVLRGDSSILMYNKGFVIRV